MTHLSAAYMRYKGVFKRLVLLLYDSMADKIGDIVPCHLIKPQVIGRDLMSWVYILSQVLFGVVS